MSGKEEKCMFLMIIAASVLLLFVVLDGSMAISQEMQAVVLDKEHLGENAQLRETATVDTQANTRVHYQIDYQHEKFEIITINTKYNVLTMSTNKDHYYNTNIGDIIEYKVYRGFFTGLIWNYKLIK